jgi:hypothetical protein
LNDAPDQAAHVDPHQGLGEEAAERLKVEGFNELPRQEHRTPGPSGVSPIATAFLPMILLRRTSNDLRQSMA